MKEQSATPKFGASRRGKKHDASGQEVPSITNAAVAHSEEMHHRLVQYSLTMAIRMVCIGLIFVFDGWFKLVPVIGAVALPWVAVMIANRGADLTGQGDVELLDSAPLYILEGSALNPDDAAASPDEIVTGEIVPDEPDAPVPSQDSPASDPLDGSANDQEELHHGHL